MNHCVTTCKHSHFDDVINKNIGIVVESNIHYPTIRRNNNFVDNFTIRTQEALDRMDSKHSKGVSVDKFLDELEQW